MNEDKQQSLFPSLKGLGEGLVSEHHLGNLPKQEPIDMYKLLVERYKDKKAIFIAGNTPSLKNSKEIGQIYTNRSACCNVPFTGKGPTRRCPKCNNICEIKTRPMLRSSKTVVKYKSATEGEWLQSKQRFVNMIKDSPMPINLGMYFIRDSERKFDHINIAQIVQDMMVDYGYIEDDNCLFVLPVFLGYKVDKKNAGVVITIIENIHLTFK